MPTKPTVLILMSCYCGERFITEQLDSIAAQEGVDWHLLIRNDGSPDGGKTFAIIRDYIAKFPDKIELLEGENIGWKKSFFELFKLASTAPYNHYDYYALSDQDDIWLPDKMLSAVNALDKIDNPIKLYCSSLYYYKNGINEHIIKRDGLTPSIGNCLVRNLATGCSIVFSPALLEIVAKGKNHGVEAHDFLLYKLCLLCGGEVVVDPTPHIQYRQHENNQIGSKSGRWATWQRRYHDFRTTMRERERVASLLLDDYTDDMTQAGRRQCETVANYRHSIRLRRALIHDPDFSTGLSANDRWLRLRILLGIL